MQMIKINEIFGPTVQGEGAAAGRHCLFVRVALCNLECSWCDTDYTWAFTEAKAAKHRNNKIHDRTTNLTEMTPQEVLNRLNDLWPIYDNPTMIVVSGGEPMMQQEALMPLLLELRSIGCQIHIETAGTIEPRRVLSFHSLSNAYSQASFDEVITQYNVSPKLEHSGNVLTKRYKPQVLDRFARNTKAWFKFVVTSLEDFHEIDDMVLSMIINPQRVMIMPEGNTVEGNLDSAREFADQAIARGYGISFRSHVLLWPKVDRGR